MNPTHSIASRIEGSRPRPGLVLGLALLAVASPADADPPAAPAANPAPPRSVRVAVLRTGELLPSESRGLSALSKRLGRDARAGVAAGDASEEEKRVAAAWLGAVPPALPPPLPATWVGQRLVAVIEVLPPLGNPPRRVSLGASSMLVFQPPAAVPVWVERVDRDKGNAARLLSEDLGSWIAALLATDGKERGR